MQIVLHEPGIALNTGNIGRTCTATDTPLHLIRPFGFRLNEKEIRRAGMDYWEELSVTEHINWQAFCEYKEKNLPDARLWYLSTKATTLYTDVAFLPDDCLVFGNESRGLPEELLKADPAHCLRIPMWGAARSLNLSNAVAIVLYEALRQQGFSGRNTHKSIP